MGLYIASLTHSRAAVRISSRVVSRPVRNLSSNSNSPQNKWQWLAQERDRFFNFVDQSFLTLDKNTRSRRIATIKWSVGGAIGLCVGMWLFRNQLGEFLGQGGAQVGQQIVQDKDLQNVAFEHTKRLCIQLLEDKEMQEKTANHLIKAVDQVLDNKAVNEHVKSKLGELLDDPEVRKMLSDKGVVLTNDIAADKSVEESLEKLLTRTIQSPEVRDEIAKTLRASAWAAVKGPFK